MEIIEMEYQKDRKIEMLYYGKHKNYKYYILNLGTHPTAYIAIPKGNKLYEKDYDDIYDMGYDIHVHYGLTYSRHELIGINSEDWFIGWDYSHFGDYCGYDEIMPENIRTYGKKWSTKEIINECKYAIDQIIDFETKGDE